MNLPYTGPRKAFPIDVLKLDAIRDRVCIRDPRGRSPKPSIVPQVIEGVPALQVAGDFLIRQEYRVPKAAGIRFVNIAKDENRIHRDGDVVPGALTAAKAILPIEILMHHLDLVSISIKFTDFATYGRRTVNVFRCRYAGPDEMTIAVVAYQGESIIAKGELKAKVLEAIPEGRLTKRWRLRKGQLAMIGDYCDALGMDLEGYVQRGGFYDYTYPLAYVASLPAGAIVQQMRGQGGILNSLRFDFADLPRIPMTGRRPLEVRLERLRNRPTFNKILTQVMEGVRTCCRGAAIVTAAPSPA